MVAISSVAESNAGGLKQQSTLGVAGVGKATLAATVATHPDVRRYFSDGITWVHIGKKELNYTRYVQCLKDVLTQLDIQDAEEPLFSELLQTPSEPISRSRRREEGFMMFVRESVADFLQDRKVFIILDDVCFDSDLDWFDFGAPPEEAEDQGCCFVLLTTRLRDLLPPADTVEVDVLEERRQHQRAIHQMSLSNYLGFCWDTKKKEHVDRYETPVAVKADEHDEPSIVKAVMNDKDEVATVGTASSDASSQEEDDLFITADYDDDDERIMLEKVFQGELVDDIPTYQPLMFGHVCCDTAAMTGECLTCGYCNTVQCAPIFTGTSAYDCIYMVVYCVCTIIPLLFVWWPVCIVVMTLSKTDLTG
jgi:hypothetical protein